MKKKILLLLLSILLTGVTAYAAGDLQVNGGLGIGMAPHPSAKLAITGVTRGLMVEMSNNNGLSASYGIDFSLDRGGSDDLSADVVSFAANVTLGDSANRTISGWVYPVSNNIRFRSLTAGTSTITSPVFTNARFSFAKTSSNARTFTVNSTASNIIARGHVDDGAGGAVNYSDLRNIWVANSSFVNSTAAKLTGIWVDKISGATNNYGIVLNGDGDGADIVFGTTQQARIYSSAGRLYAQDTFGNQTILSPHDPDTGEWIYYSKNIKTGKVVRVDMERLVKAVENITGETFMIETPEEEK